MIEYVDSTEAEQFLANKDTYVEIVEYEALTARSPRGGRARNRVVCIEKIKTFLLSFILIRLFFNINP